MALCAGQTQAGEVRIASAGNFAATLRVLAERFETATGHRTVVSHGSTGKLYAQIMHGAPHEVFLAADRERPRQLEADGLAVAGSRFTYATGRLVLWSRDPALVDADGEVLLRGESGRLAMANPKTAPYGAAARAVLQRLGLDTRAGAGQVYGDSVTQAYQFIASEAVALGFVALSQVRLLPPGQAGSAWLVPAEYHPSLEQQAVLLRRGAGNRAALAFLHYLRSPEAASLIETSGYSIERRLARAEFD